METKLQNDHPDETEEWVKARVEEAVKARPRSYWRRRVRHSIPDPETLEQDLRAVYELFSTLTDPKTNRSEITTHSLNQLIH